ncbi:MAG: isoprenylcysteine carboxylmethyltransferase family protein [Anaerolineaceae bacterium]|nr:isoprenylcysteine carboxylmethyltransferase family protein [Anaerolineaceae bacterium]MCB9099003.1 isoprenylcysteine carboxylmethyltransferase family protein [Anaerolineales bacterium]
MAKLILQSILGLAFLLLVLALALFVSAGSLSYWQAWLYLAVFALCSLLITVYLIRYDQRLLASRVKAGPVAETQRNQQIIQSLASLSFMGLFIVAGLDFRFHWSAVPPLVSVLASGLVILGFFIVFLVFRENSYTSAIIEVAAEQTVITSGPYSVVRHPMYAGASLLLIASPPALGSWVALPFAILLILVVAARLLAEEQFLLTSLTGYAAYCQQVRYHLLPFIW